MSTSVVSSVTSLLSPPITPGQAHRLFGVADHQVLGVQGALLAVQGYELFALGGHAHHDLGPTHLGEVEGVQGLAQLQEDVVGHVHHVADGVVRRRP